MKAIITANNDNGIKALENLSLLKKRASYAQKLQMSMIKIEKVSDNPIIIEFYLNKFIRMPCLKPITDGMFQAIHPIMKACDAEPKDYTVVFK